MAIARGDARGATDTGSSSSKRRLLTPREAADRLAVDASTVRRWCAKSAMRSYKVGPYNQVRIEEAEVLRHLRLAE